MKTTSTLDYMYKHNNSLKINIKKILVIFLLLSNIRIQNLNILVLSQNLGGISNVTNLTKDKLNRVPNENYQKFLDELQKIKDNKNPDVIILGVQEIIELKPKALIVESEGSFLQKGKRFLGLQSTARINTENHNVNIIHILEKIFLKNDYVIHNNSNITMSTFVIIKKDLVSNVFPYKNINFNGLGVSNYEFNEGFWGQKGGSITLIEVTTNDDKKHKFLHVNSHLDSAEPNERYKQFLALLKATKGFVDEKNVQDYIVFFSGDLNSRVTNQEKDEIKNLKDEHPNKKEPEIYKDNVNRDLEEYKKYLKMEEIKNIFEFEEEIINFLPTYKLNIGQDECWEASNFENCYMISGKSKYAYTDRIFYSLGGQQKLEVESYDVINSKMFSDHLTVQGSFKSYFENDQEKEDFFETPNTNYQLNGIFHTQNKNEEEKIVDNSEEDEIEEVESVDNSEEDEIEEVESVENIDYSEIEIEVVDNFEEKEDFFEENEPVKMLKLIEYENILELTEANSQYFNNVYEIREKYEISDIKEAFTKVYNIFKITIDK